MSTELQKQSMKNRIRFKCLSCGKDTFLKKEAHRCIGGFKLRGLKWQKINPLAQ